MSDAKLRELERRWRESGAADDEAAYLLERVRVGELPRDRLDLAAHCGYTAAQMASGYARPSAAIDDAESSERSIYEWTQGLVQFGKAALVRAAVAGAECVRQAWDNGVEHNPWRDQATTAWKAARKWLECPCDAHAAEVRQVIAPASRLVLRRTAESPDPWLLFAAPAVDAGRCVVDDPAHEGGACYRAVSRAAKVLAHQRGKDHQADFVDENAEILERVQRDVAEWALRP